MNKQLSLINSSFDRIFNSPLASFVDKFFSESLPYDLINREETFPKYNIYRDNRQASSTTKDGFIIELSLAGYNKEDLDVYTKYGVLFVEDKPTKKNVQKEYLYKGITTKHFKWSLKLPKNAEIVTVGYINGLLTINVEVKAVKEDPERISYEIFD